MSIVFILFSWSSLGAFGAGMLAEAVGAQWIVGGFAMVLALLSILGLAFIPRIRKLD